MDDAINSVCGFGSAMLGKRRVVKNDEETQ
jgi:hypothetical protein